eukprot:CAMPEP_0202917618 /NCGR_PEP_ID=MMETSP1392-20130828/71421_1 /ASSEMBLY_ACC=CAM_ASM_000868 /TAXON_ID=225041 /ORGANISM="Chlamydomonas chlamydogama, Strain SAG 11-48b" /LENGTH=58 /DNA_ID=CAMNT_0049610423 /DNA_START=33 /DNA_END=209 /DNA_ORIENTATION=-
MQGAHHVEACTAQVAVAVHLRPPGPDPPGQQGVVHMAPPGPALRPVHTALSPLVLQAR